MNGRRQKINTGAVPLFIAGLIIFTCGLILFVIKPHNTSVYIYSISMCVSGILFVLISMIKDFKSKSTGAASKSTKAPGNQTEGKK